MDKKQIKKRMAEIKRSINSIARIAQFMLPSQLKPYEDMAEEYKQLEIQLKALQ